jgi:ribosomal-protein-alanine N-acetyltransferase
MLQIETARLRLLPYSVAAAQAAIGDRAGFAAGIGARVPDEWPAEDLRDFLPAYGQIVSDEAARAGWGIWLMVLPAEQALIGDIGFKGAPDAAGTVEIGYSVLPGWRGQGYATEALRALSGWAAQQPGVRRVIAECLADNAASIRVLETSGLRQIGRDESGLKWEL